MQPSVYLLHVGELGAENDPEAFYSKVSEVQIKFLWWTCFKDILHFGNTADLHRFTGIVSIKLKNYFSHALFRLQVLNNIIGLLAPSELSLCHGSSIYRVWNSCKMPSTSIIMEGNQVFRYNEKSDTRESVSNFSISLLGTVHISSTAGGPGMLVEIERYPDSVKE